MQSLQAGKFDAATRVMPRTIREIVSGNEPPVSQIAKIVPMSQITAQLEFELIKVNDLVSVGNKLNTGQIQFVAEAILEAFPNETLADFKIACQRGCIGQYGDVWRLDGIVIRGWIEKYLNEKYQLIETEAMKNKANREGTRAKPSAILPKDAPGISAAGMKALEDMRKIVDETKKVSKIPGMTDADIRRNGQLQPPKKTALTAGMKWFKILGVIDVEAVDLKHAKQQIRLSIKSGYLDFGASRGKSRRK